MYAKFRDFLRRFFDIRTGELGRTLLMSLYLLMVLFAYYILKPVSRAIFLSSLDIDKLPWLYVLVAAVGGVIAYFYSKVAVRFSLKAAVDWATAVTVGCLVLLWWLLPQKWTWIYYAFNIWVSLFGIVLVSQGWLVAANVFTAREAKRLYGILGLGAVVGAAFGGSFTSATVEIFGPENLVLASAVMVIFAYLAFRAVMVQRGVSLAGAKGGEAEETDFSLHDIVNAIVRYRHLQVIIWIIALTYIVDVVVEYQFSVMAKLRYPDKADLTAFFGYFYGLYLNLITFVLQFFLTALVVGRFGVGGTLQIMPVTIAVASIGTYVSPGILSTACARLTEAATRYTFNRTGMELLYLPLPVDMKNRCKAFIDVFADRLSRGMGGMLLVVLTSWLGMQTRNLSLVVLAICIAWIILSVVAQREYVQTVSRRLASRRLNLDELRISVSDPATVALLEETTRSAVPRQVVYALSLLEESPGYRLNTLLDRLSQHTSPEVLNKVFDIARGVNYAGLLEAAKRDVHNPAITRSALSYVLAVDPAAKQLAAGLLRDADARTAREAIEALSGYPEIAEELIPMETLGQLARDADPCKRSQAAIGVRIRGDSGTSALFDLLRDHDTAVAADAIRAAGAIQNREYVGLIIESLGQARLRGAAIEALERYGPRIIGTLGDMLHDTNLPVQAKRQVPRVLRRIPEQRAVDVLLASIDHPDLTIRGAVLKALGRLREGHPELNFGPEPVTRQIHREARYYYELFAALEPLRNGSGTGPVARLLARTIQERLKRTVERLFFLLGLQYPPKEIYAAYVAVERGSGEAISTAMDFLDNVLDRELKRVLLPLFDSSTNPTSQTPASGRQLFGIQSRTAESAVGEMLASRDEWMVCCAMAAAAELGFRSLKPDIEAAAAGAGHSVAAVARTVLQKLA